MESCKQLYFAFFSILFFLVACSSEIISPTDTPAEEATPEQVNFIVPTLEIVVEEAFKEPWQIVQQLNIDFEPTYVAFMDENVGATICGNNSHFPSFTQNGGETWIQPEQKLFCPRTFEIVDPQSIWMCNPNQGIKMSKDGGNSFEHLTLPVGGSCEFLSFLDETTGWGVAHNTLSVTEDGSNSWTEIPLPEDVSDIAAISLHTLEIGYLLDFDGTLFQTQDGGNNWVSQTLDTGNSELEIMNLGYSSAAIHFFDEENGFVVLNLAGGGKSEVVVLNTANGGKTWERYPLPVALGTIYLSHDGKYLTVTDMLDDGKITLLKHQ